ncbi:hypothetical protein BZA70DRAFT_290093 [Myxozyma melibiosi]|uniref:COX assembly mitochondrial protein n=1 Tax=Myxozyma melibiosi TaxID=54550 RepID=A0ABR1F4K2_9ASCO
MHPNLSDPNYIDCTDIIAALSNCHQELNFMERQFGCNNIQESMNKCLHEARMLQRKQNNAKARNDNSLSQRIKNVKPEDAFGAERGREIREEYARQYRLKRERDVSFTINR